jgi:hypothetical protein
VGDCEIGKVGVVSRLTVRWIGFCGVLGRERGGEVVARVHWYVGVIRLGSIACLPG